MFIEPKIALNTYKTAVSPALVLLCMEHLNFDEVRLSPTLKSFYHNKSVGQDCCPMSILFYRYLVKDFEIYFCCQFLVHRLSLKKCKKFMVF